MRLCAGLVLGDVGERHDGCDIAGRPHPVGGSAVLVDADLAPLARGDANSVQAELGGARDAPGADDYHIAA